LVEAWAKASGTDKANELRSVSPLRLLLESAKLSGLMSAWA
jgi:hypothetical protein